MRHIFPIFDPITEEHVSYKPRELVHADGDWHRGIQANLIRGNASGSFDILMQKRSTGVDISGQKFDQSLATQMLDIDNLNEKQALQRGLKEELGIKTYQATKLNRKLRIIKTYREHPNVLNRELLSLFIIKLTGNNSPHIATTKITSLAWMEWSDFLAFFGKNEQQFTKTAQLYFSYPPLTQAIEDQSRALLSLAPTPEGESLDPDILIRVDKWPAPRQTYEGSEAAQRYCSD